MDVVIIGAGITGLATAISLRRCGHKVTIYERSSLNNEIGAAINIPPNASRFLAPWGLDSHKLGFVASKGIRFISPSSLEELHAHDSSAISREFGAPLYYAHREDLHKGLKDLATDVNGTGMPVKLHLKSAVTSYNAQTPSITMNNGNVITADLIVAADGVHSIAIKAISGGSTVPQSAAHTNCSYRFLIDAAELEADPETIFSDRNHQRPVTTIIADPGKKRRLIFYLCRNGKFYNFVVLCYREDMITKSEDWQAPVDKAEVLDVLSGYHPRVLAAIKKATEVKRWPLLYRRPVKTWSKGRLVLAGDAVHPMLPHQAQAGAQGMEDGLALGLVMNGVTNISQIEERIEIYEKIRRNRASSIQILSKVGSDEECPPEIVEFLDGKALPSELSQVKIS
ncbi:FAD binding domain-containing protein [Calycina marina]|uniref:FAD binding domain-containing protein n=1 Tax=Calycina marina TaxID=1763456 RepID=A0A9P7Z7D9_9HELO|nr:FAD binding domain-containing protein [Calycina marina]